MMPELPVATASTGSATRLDESPQQASAARIPLGRPTAILDLARKIYETVQCLEAYDPDEEGRAGLHHLLTETQANAESYLLVLTRQSPAESAAMP